MSRSKVKGQQGQKMCLALPTPLHAYKWYALAANHVQQQRTGPFRGCHGVFFEAWLCSIGAWGCSLDSMHFFPTNVELVEASSTLEGKSAHAD